MALTAISPVLNERITYTAAFEQLLKEESEKAEVMCILHQDSFKWYNYWSMCTNIPVIVLSAIIGFLSPIELFNNQPIFLGALSVLASIIKTLDNYMDFTKRSQTHYLTALSYKKISKLIQIQLSLEKECRIIPNDLLTVITNDMENIASSEPAVPDHVINGFKKRYPDSGTARPALCAGLTSVRIHTRTERIELNTTVHVDVADVETATAAPTASAPKSRRA